MSNARVLLAVLFILGLIYLIWPGPSSISDILPLNPSLKSDEPGDTIQNKNVVAYFSDYRRPEVTSYYKDSFSYLNFFGFKIPTISLNHPPEEAFTFIRDQQPSTYLEQFTYPLRDSLFVNGFEPFDITGKPYRIGATNIFINDSFYKTKTTLRYYNSPVYARVLVYILIWVSLLILIKLSKKAILEK